METHGAPPGPGARLSLVGVHLVLYLGVPTETLLPSEDLNASAILSRAPSVFRHHGVVPFEDAALMRSHDGRPASSDRTSRVARNVISGDDSPQVVLPSYGRFA